MCQIDKKFILPDVLWEKVKPLLPKEKKKKKPGRPRMDDKLAMCAIFYVLRTGIQWKALPSCLGASSTVHDRFVYWQNQGVFKKMWQEGLKMYDKEKGIQWQWQAIDGCHIRAPLGGEHTGPSYKHRGKTGSNRSLLTDAKGAPLAIVLAAANRLDFQLFEPTLLAFAVAKPKPTSLLLQHLSADKGYDYAKVDELVLQWGYTAHIRRKGEEENPQPVPKYKARRWVVERTHAWMNNFRRLLTRWERKAKNYLAFLHFACAYITFSFTSLFAS